MNLLIIGAGQLGSRHLQGLLKLKEHSKIYVLDPSFTSLEIAKDRANEINHSHEVFYNNDWKNLPDIFELVIIATGANVRQKVIIDLLKICKVKNLVLEKILFQDLKSYSKIEDLLLKMKIPTWVNHPRRMYSHYKEIKKTILNTNEKITFQVNGGNWGLACNALHFIDLCAYLTNSSVKNIDFEWINQNIENSKRKNNIEFTGSIKGKMLDDSSFLISSFEGEESNICINISSNSNRWNIKENNNKILFSSIENKFSLISIDIESEFQSTLTTKMAFDIINSGFCDLPTYEEACLSHVPFINKSIEKYNEITGGNLNYCPIT